jgi:hypothetical protein
MYSTVGSVLELVPLLSNVNRGGIRSFISRASGILDYQLSSIYKVPLDKLVRDGRVVLIKGSNVVTSCDGSFSKLGINSYLYLPDFRYTLRVIDINEVDILTVDEDAILSVSGGYYIELPSWVVITVEFIAVNLLLNSEFSRKGYNQEGIQKYKDDYLRMSREYLENIKLGYYYDSSLVPASSGVNFGRLVSYDMSIKSDIISNIEKELKGL